VKPKNIFIDCTATYYTGLNTGIQRVVRNIIARIDDIEKDFGIKCTPVILKNEKFIAITKEDLLQRKPSQNVQKIKILLSKILPSKIYFFLKNTYGKLFLMFSKPTIDAPSIEIGADDILFGVDVFWELGFFNIVERYKKLYNFKFFLLVYDIIPILFPNFYRDQTPKKFNRYFSKTYLFDAIFTTSFANAEQIKSLDEKVFPNISKKPIEVFYLGSDIKSIQGSQNPKEEILQITQSNDVYLMIGTLEPRKNHDFVLNAFEKIWSLGSSKKLIIAGRIGWLCEDTLKRIRSSKYYNKNLFFFSHLSDDDINYLYKHSKALILASKIEGFGLPLVEAMYHNLAVIASDIAVFREVGKDYPIYFSLSNIDSLIDAIHNVEHKKANVSFSSPISWDDSVKELFSKVLKVYQDLINKNKYIGGDKR
jgi:alpha-1,2-rhamnosyltransferase